jgi:hypothetical protein
MRATLREFRGTSRARLLRHRGPDWSGACVDERPVLMGCGDPIVPLTAPHATS